MSGTEASTALREQVVVVQGASRGIGLALVRTLLARGGDVRVFATCRTPAEAHDLHALGRQTDALRIVRLDVLDHGSIAAAAEVVGRDTGRVDLLVNCAGVLHGPTLVPEKRLADAEPAGLELAFKVNAIGALLVAKAFERSLRASPGARYVALSARVGSIGDNRRGGWYAYRASKAALNMMVRTLAVEWSRLPRPIACFVLHPGTVATGLSEPFRKSTSHRIFEADEAAGRLLATIQALGAEQTGGFYAYDGAAIEW